MPQLHGVWIGMWLQKILRNPETCFPSALIFSLILIHTALKMSQTHVVNLRFDLSYMHVVCVLFLTRSTRPHVLLVCLDEMGTLVSEIT